MTNLWFIFFVVACLGLVLIFSLYINLRRKFHFAQSRVELMNLKRTDFVANVSHELKTPLTSIKGYTETLRSGAVKDIEKADIFLKKIEDNVERLDLLIHDILDLSRLEASDTHLKLETIKLEEFFQNLRDQFALRLEQKKQTLVIETGVLHLLADRHLLEQAFNNLVGNANRYCQEGACITIKGGSVELDGRAWNQFLVSDNGPGIPEEDLPRIFERFYRADKSRNRAFGGTGLGLAIVKHIILSHQGRIFAENLAPKGICFRLLFPK